MRVLLRADASPQQGTGHVMRCLTLAEGLIRRGHEVYLATNESGVPWLEDVVARSEVTTHSVDQHQLGIELIEEINPDWLVIDSYVISSEAINSFQSSARILAIVDGDDRGINADLYVDHNLGAETLPWPENIIPKLLAGSEYALVRDSILVQRKEYPWVFPDGLPHILAFMGGSDPTGTICQVGEAIAKLGETVTSTIVASAQWQQTLQGSLQCNPSAELLLPTPDLPSLLGKANIAVSAAGTSAWELCTLGIPSVLLAVVDNQDESLDRLILNGLAVGIKRADINQESISRALDLLLSDEVLRQELSERCLSSFDGKGKERVAEAMERILQI